MLKRGSVLVALCVLLLATCVQAALAIPASPTKDVGGDGYDDVALLYSYGSGKVGAWAFDSAAPSPPNAHVSHRQWWISGNGWGTTAKITPLLADVTGDHKADAVMMYAYSSTQMGLLVLGGAATTNIPRTYWKSTATGWAAGRTKLTATKSLSGGTPFEPVALYNYSNGKIALWRFKQSGSGVSFDTVKVWESPARTWDWAKCKIAGGDFNGDGKGDVAILYDYGNNTTGLWVFTSTGTAYTKALAWKSAAGVWRWDRSKFLAGDIDGDLKDEVVVAYDTVGMTRMWVFNESGAQMVGSNWGLTYPILSTSRISCADPNHDGYDDIVIFTAEAVGAGSRWLMLPSLGGTGFDTALHGLWEKYDWSYAKSMPVP